MSQDGAYKGKSSSGMIDDPTNTARSGSTTSLAKSRSACLCAEARPSLVKFVTIFPFTFPTFSFTLSTILPSTCSPTTTVGGPVWWLKNIPQVKKALRQCKHCMYRQGAQP